MALIPIQYFYRGKPKHRAVQATVYGPLAVHATVGEAGFWTVTHVTTGQALYRFIPSKTEAVNVATVLKDHPGWLEKSEAGIVVQTREAVRAALKKIGIAV